MEMIIVMLVTLSINSIANALCFLFGAKIGQKVAKQEIVELPRIPNPITKVKERRELKEYEMEQDSFQKELENLDNYPYKQVDIP